MTIIEDTRQQVGKHSLKHKYFEESQIKIVRSKLPVGDYANIKDLSVIVDTKKDIQEIIGNVTTQHERFRNECILAQESDIKLIILIENKDNISKVDDLYQWYNWRLKKNKKALTGNQLAKILHTMEEKYGVKFEFCTPENAGKMICDFIKGGN